MYACRRLAALTVLALGLGLPARAIAAVDIEAPTVSFERAFQVVPNEQPAVNQKRQSALRLSRRVYVKSEAASLQVREGYYRGLALIALGTLGLIVISYRIYGRSQGNSAT